MPRHTRASSGATAAAAAAAAGNPYPSMNQSAAAMYGGNQRMTMPPNDFFLPAPSADPMQQMAQQHHQQQQPPMSARSFDNTAYAPAAAAQQQQQQQQPVMTPSTPSMPITLPPSHRPSSGAWTPHDDQQLMAARAQGLNWAQIKDAYFPGKTANACRKRHERLAERRDADDWDQRKFQRLAKEYMAMRREIWTGLAQRTGEKWNVVEQKCMTNGLKNLQSASRAASRHDRLQSQSVTAMVGGSALPSGGGGGPLPGYDDDSGISGIALTPVDDLDASFSSPEAGSSSGGSAYHHHHHHHHHGHHRAHHQHHQQQHYRHQQRYPQQLHPDMQFGLPLPPPPGPYMGPYGMPAVAPPVQQQQHHRYSSSVSSSASGYRGSAGSSGGGSSSQGSSPYMPGQRLPSADMGIGSLINRSGGL